MVTQAEFFSEDEISQQPADAPPVQAINLTPEEFFDGDEVQIHKPEDEGEKLNFAQRFGQDIEKRMAVDNEIMDAFDQGEIGTAEALLQTIGKTGFGSVLDFLGEAVVSAGRGLSAITPDVIEKPLIEGATSAGRMFLNTDIGQKGLEAAKKGADAWDGFKKENPRAARNIEAVVNIGILLAPAKAKPKTTTSTAFGRTGEVLETKAAAQTFAKRQDFIDDLVRPKQTAAVRKEQVARTGEAGVLRSKQVTPSASEKQMTAEVLKIPEVSKSKTLQGNHNAIANEVTKEANQLKTLLAEKDVIFPRKEFNAQLNGALTRLQENPLLVGDAQKTAGRIVQKMRQIVDGKKSTAANLLAARKELDAWIRSQKGPNIFDPKQENALSIAIREVRNTTNDFIAGKATNIGVKDSLKKQSTLLRAMDNIAPKAGDEAGNIVLRAWQNAMQVLPFRGEFNQIMATAFGVGGLGASAMFAPFFTKIVIGTIATYSLGKAVMGPRVKKGLATLLKAMDEAIIKTKDKNLIKQMRLDRALILELLEVSGEKLDEVDENSSPSKANQDGNSK